MAGRRANGFVRSMLRNADVGPLFRTAGRMDIGHSLTAATG